MALDIYTQKKYFNKVKIGDKLFIKNLAKIYSDYYCLHSSDYAIIHDKSFPGINNDMLGFSESFVTVIGKETNNINKYIYHIKEDNGCWTWTLHFIDIAKSFKDIVLPIE